MAGVEIPMRKNPLIPLHRDGTPSQRGLGVVRPRPCPAEPPESHPWGCSRGPSAASSSSLHRFRVPSALSRGQQPGQPRGAWILGNEAARNGVGRSHYTTPRAGSRSSVLSLHFLYPSLFLFLPSSPSSQPTIPLGSLGACPSSSVPARGSVYFK